MITDLRLAVRALLGTKGFSLAALGVLALGIAANTVVFSLVNGLLLRPLPFPDADRVVSLHATHPTQFPESWDDAGISFADLQDIRRESESLEDVGGYLGRRFTVYGEEAVQVLGGSITPNLFRILGVEPALGRGFRDDEGALPGFERVVLLSDGLWKSRFAADRSVVGSTMRINERELEIVGVMPERFRFPELDELWVPYDPGPVATNRARRAFLAVGRLREEASIDGARAEIDAIAERLAERYPETNRNFGLHLLPYRDLLVTAPRRTIAATLLTAVGLVLLVACANLASLFLARGTARQREIAVRAALGAGRRRIARQLLVESVLLGSLGAGLGALLAAWGLDALVASFPAELPYWLRFDLDWRVAAFLVLLALAASVAVGLLPSWRATRIDLIPALGSGRDPGAARGTVGLQSVLVVGQIAVSLALLVGAGLMFRSFLEVTRADLGFDGGSLLTFRVVLAGDGFDPPAAKVGFFRDATERIEAIPGVRAAAASSAIPAGDGGSAARAVTRESPLADGSEIGVQVVAITPRFFDALDVELLEGRPFAGRDLGEDAAPVVIVNHRLAARLWPGRPATEREIGLVTSSGADWRRVVGVAPDVQYEEVGEETAQSSLNVYVPYSSALFRSMAFLVRAEDDPADLAAPVRSSLRSFAPGVPAFLFRTMDEVRYLTSWEQRLFSRMFVAFAVSALALACLGTYGLVSYQAANRRREIGVRLALGASPPDVVRLFLRQGVLLGGIGLGLGFALALAVSRALAGVVYRVAPQSPWIFASTAVLLALSVVLASYLPARRATRVPPMDALRQE